MWKGHKHQLTHSPFKRTCTGQSDKFTGPKEKVKLKPWGPHLRLNWKYWSTSEVLSSTRIRPNWPKEYENHALSQPTYQRSSKCRFRVWSIRPQEFSPAVHVRVYICAVKVMQRNGNLSPTDEFESQEANAVVWRPCQLLECEWIWFLKTDLVWCNFPK